MVIQITSCKVLENDRERVRGFLARRHKVAGRGNRRITFDEIHRNREVLCLERLPRPAPLWASR